MASEDAERTFSWQYVDPLPEAIRSVPSRTEFRPDPALRTELEYRAQCFLGKWYRDLGAMQPGSGRHNAVRSKARAAGGLVAAGLLDEREAVSVLLDACVANGLTQDPGGTAERTIRDGLEYGAQTPWAPSDLPDSPVWRTRLERPPKMGVNTFPSVSGSESIDSGPDGRPLGFPYTSGNGTFAPRTAEEIGALALPEIEWIAYPWVAAGCLTELDGKPKRAGKTTWGLAMVSSVVQGQPFLSQPTLETPVVLMSEQNERTLQVALRRANLHECRDLHIVLRHELGDMRWPDMVEQAAAYCRQIGSRMLMIDTLPPFLGLRGDAENHAADALLAVQPLQEVCARDGLGILFTRHERKAGGDVGDSGRGSSAYGGAVDVILSLRRGNPSQVRDTVRLLESLSRYDETPAHLVIELQGGRYVALADNGELAFTEVQYQVVSALKDKGRLRTQQFKEFVAVGRTQLYVALEALTERGVIRRDVLRSGAHEYYLPPDEDDEQLELDETG